MPEKLNRHPERMGFISSYRTNGPEQEKPGLFRLFAHELVRTTQVLRMV